MINGTEAIRIGKVSSVNSTKRTARVVFEDKDEMVSAELPVIATIPEIKSVDSQNGKCTLEIRAWLPYVEQMVVVALLPNGGGDGFIIGGL